MREQLQVKQDRAVKNRKQKLLERTEMLALRHLEDEVMMNNVQDIREIQNDILQEEIDFKQNVAAHRKQAFIDDKQAHLSNIHQYVKETVHHNRLAQNQAAQAKKIYQKQQRANKSRVRVLSGKAERVSDMLSRVELVKEQRQKKREAMRAESDARLRDAEERRLRQQQEKLAKLKEHDRHLQEVRRRKVAYRSIPSHPCDAGAFQYE